MAGCLNLKDGSNSNNVEIIQAHGSDSFDSDYDSLIESGDFDEYRDRVRILFDRVLSVFSKEVSVQPIPAVLGDGKAVDLFKLLWVVRKRGGYDVVSKSNLWGFVAEECGLGFESMASVKLIFIKYLKQLDLWLRQISDDRGLGSGNCGVVKNLELELETEFRRLLSDGEVNKYSTYVKLRYQKDGNATNLDNADNEVNLLVPRDIDELHGNAGIVIDDDDEKHSTLAENNVEVASKSVVEQGLDSKKRKRGSLSFLGMINWVIQVAKHPDDTTVGRLPDCSKWKEHGTEEFWVQALLARDALLVRKHDDLNTEESHLQKKVRMHPSMYEDGSALNHQSAARLRCSKRLLSLTKSHFCPCCNPCSAKEDKVARPCTGGKEGSPKKPAFVTAEPPTMNIKEKMSTDDPVKEKVSIGPLFQADVPEWTGIIFKSDSKWLGLRMWPPEGEERKAHIKLDPIGKGRTDTCECPVPGSIECVRFHIAEKRMKLKFEVGLLFYHWKFSLMGEEVSLSWTAEEEKRFKEIVILNSESPNKFWSNTTRFFPTKTRKKLVSYYFNAFLIQRRSYQNRVTPKNIDSDDEETEFGSIGGSFGSAAIYVPQSKALLCIENKQCNEFP